jgi:2-haloacid dehalogenase
MRLTDFRALTFDCYGTLIDWESGLLTALAPLRARAAKRLEDEAALAAFAEYESRQQEVTPDMLYSDLLTLVHRQLTARWGAVPDDEADQRFGASVGDWPAFPDSGPALRYLKQHYLLVILSNVDRASFARSNVRLGVEFDAVLTAQQIGSYKPDPRNFAFLLDRLGEFGLPRERILHTAQSLFHDHVPAQAAGLRTAWIDRRAGRQGSGATAPVDGEVRYDFRFESLGAMAEAHRAELAAPS